MSIRVLIRIMIEYQLSQLSDAANQEFDAVFVIPVDSAGIRQGLQELNECRG